MEEPLTGGLIVLALGGMALGIVVRQRQARG
jgi:hypothetical protein